jgi:uncharacterized repeat protein (TIGR03803 family)
MYGTTESGGINGDGNVFSINTDGTGYTDLFDFNDANGYGPFPYGGSLALSNGVLYGTAYIGCGSNNDGVLFSVKTNGSGFKELLVFNGTNGANPDGAVIVSGNTIYGMSSAGGANGDGNIYSIDTSGSGFKDVLDFNYTNGTTPYGTLALNGSTLYGMTTGGGTIGGVVFSIGTSGSGYTILNKLGVSGAGAFPDGSLIYSNGVLYGMTYSGGKYGNGTIFGFKL